MEFRTVSRLCVALACALISSAAHSQAFRTYLSIDGSDANPCTVQLPCRLLPAALTAVRSGGEVWMLDSANFNTATVDITKSVTILAVPGAVGSVVATGGAAIRIAEAFVDVSLRNLVIVPLPSSGGITGIEMTNGRSLTIQGTLIANIPNGSVSINAVSRPSVKVLDSVIRNTTVGIYVTGGATLDVSGTKLVGNQFGVLVDASETNPFTTTFATVTDTVISGGGTGLLADGRTANATARWSATRVTSSHNNYGFSCGASAGTASCNLGSSMASGNTQVGIVQSGNSTFRSLGNNIVIDNTMNTAGTITPLAGT